MGIIAIGKQSTVMFSSFQIVCKINCWFPANETNVVCCNLFRETGLQGAGMPSSAVQSLVSVSEGRAEEGVPGAGLGHGLSLAGSSVARV